MAKRKKPEWSKLAEKCRKAKRPGTRAKYAVLAAEAFSNDVPVGTPVCYWLGLRDDSREGEVSVVRSAAEVRGGTPVVWVTGTLACIALTHIEVI